MSTRVSQVYGESDAAYWHGWTECFEGDWLYLDVSLRSDEAMTVTLDDDEKTTAKAMGLFVRMPLDVFDRIARQYVQRKDLEAALDAQIKREWAAFEAETGKCAMCHPRNGTPTGLLPHCPRCGGTGKPQVTTTAP